MTRRLEWQDKTKIIDLFFPTKKNFQSVRVILFLISPPPPKTVSASKKSFAADPSIHFCRKHEVFMIRFNASWLQPVFTVGRSLTARWCLDWLILCMWSFGQVCTFIHRRKKDLAKSGQSLWSKKKVNTANDRFSLSPLFNESSHWNRSWLGAISYLLITPEVSLWLKDQQKHH